MVWGKYRMEISLKNNLLKVTHKLLRNEVYKIKKSSNFENITIMKKPLECVGFSSKTSFNKHILCLDYDNCAYSVVIDDIRYLQLQFKVSHAYIFTTSQRTENNEKVGNYHVIFLSVHSISEIFTMLTHTHIDKNFIDSPLRTKYRSYVLRLSKKNGKRKPKYIETIFGNPIPEISSAHKVLLSKLYKNIRHSFYRNEDSGKKVRMQTYETFK